MQTVPVSAMGSAVSCPRYMRVRAVGIDGRAWTDAEVKGA
jgi:hypothetical protein